MAKQILLMLLLLLCAHLMLSLAANFYQTMKLAWGGNRAQILDNGNLLQLSLDNTSGSGFESIQEYLFGKIDMEIKVVPGNSAGTVTAYYLSSQGGLHDEIDYEFLGNSSGEPYTLHTNVYSQGVDNREQQFILWFDPRLDFHTYSILWNPINIIFYVDNTPIRVFQNLESQLGVPYPRMQPLRLYSSIWNADDWATRGGLVKTDWSQAPFTASYRNFNANACVISGGITTCPPDRGTWWRTTLNAAELEKLRLVRQNNMIYDYCCDARRFPQGFPPDCSVPILSESQG